MKHNSSLQHAGVLGMKWGHHKPQQDQPKLNHRSKLEEKYRSEGMSDIDAASAANKRIKTEKAIAAVAGLTIAAAATYVAVNHYNNKVDKVIKSGKVFQNMSLDSNKGVEQAFYASRSTRDNMKYRGMYGMQLGKEGVYETKIKAIKDIKIASKETAKNSFQHLVENDESFKKAVAGHLNELNFPLPKQNALKREALKEIESGKISKKAYEAFNLSLTSHNNENANKAASQFYELLKTKGYEGIQDINDMKYSGYGAKTPTILFGGASALAIDKRRLVEGEEIAKDFVKGYSDILVTKLAKTGAVTAGGVVGINAVNKQLKTQLSKQKIKR